MKTEKEWAELLSQVLSPEQFTEFCHFFDGCDDVEFSSALQEIDEKVNPHLYDTNS